MRKCVTCKEIEAIQEIDKIYEGKKPELTKVLKARLVTEKYDKKNRLISRIEFKARDINFCPKCGKKIDKKIWKI